MHKRRIKRSIRRIRTWWRLAFEGYPLLASICVCVCSVAALGIVFLIGGCITRCCP